ncbi:hypothetical protein Tco_0851194 [Tanacetum coccineum]
MVANQKLSYEEKTDLVNKERYQRLAGKLIYLSHTWPDIAYDVGVNPVQDDRTKHIEVDRHFIKEKLEAKIITLLFVRSEDQLADILTKAVSERSLYKYLGKLNFGDPTIQLEGEYHLQQCEFCNNECDEQHRFTRRYYLEAKMHIKKDILLKCRVLPLMSTSSCTNSTVTEACRDEIAAFIGIADLLV